MSETQDLTRKMARYTLAHHDFPARARAMARDAIADCVGCILAGGREDLAAPLQATLPSFATAQPQFPALMLGLGRYAAPADAALYNGTIAHALDFDDTNHPGYAHPSAAIVPAMFAVAPLVEVTGADLIDAYIVGFEWVGKLGRALNTQHYRRGWHATGTFGTMAAAAAAGRLLGLDEDKMIMALGMAASSAAGVRANFGSMTKPLHAGQAARNGVLAALLARAGFTASAEVMEHRFGYVGVFNDGIGAEVEHLHNMGRDLEILTVHGLALKPYAACGATHTAIEAAEALHDELAGRTIESVHMGVCDMAFQPLIHVMPHSPLEGKFSLHFCVAAALLRGKVSLATFSDEVVNDQAVRDLIPRMTMVTDTRWQDDSEFPTEVVVRTTGGERLARYVPLARGKPERWFSIDDLQRKFTDCARVALPEPAIAPVWQALLHLDGPQASTSVLAALAAATA